MFPKAQRETGLLTILRLTAARVNQALGGGTDREAAFPRGGGPVEILFRGRLLRGAGSVIIQLSQSPSSEKQGHRSYGQPG